MHTYVIRAYTQCFFVSVCACGLSLLTRTRPITQKQCSRPFHPCQPRPCHLHRLVDYNAIHKAETWNCQSLIGERPASILPSNRPRWLDGPSAGVVVAQTRCAPPRRSGLAAKPVWRMKGTRQADKKTSPARINRCPVGLPYLLLLERGRSTH